MDSKDRFMLDVQPMDYRSRNAVPLYTAYQLGDDKTFETLFNSQCQKLLRIVEHFENKTGKYAIKGYPHKLGLLLSGIPGTGKTSLIKAMAHRTGRHIVNINLSHISTNTDLRKIFFNKMYQITAGNTTNFMKLEFSQVIFVLEDVDAGAREVVMDREMLAKIEEDRSAAEKSKKTREEAPVFDQGPSLAARSVRSSTPPGADRLNLSGLLNVLDGVVETPGRMVIMTTNYPEILDPALIRPGRIDKILELGYMEEPKDIISMLEHYYPERKLFQDEKDRVVKCLTEDNVKITPAQVEQLAMEEDTLQGLMDRLCSYKDQSSKMTGSPPRKFVIGSSSSGSGCTSPTSSGYMTEQCRGDFEQPCVGLQQPSLCGVRELRYDYNNGDRDEGRYDSSDAEDY